MPMIMVTTTGQRHGDIEALPSTVINDRVRIRIVGHTHIQLVLEPSRPGPEPMPEPGPGPVLAPEPGPELEPENMSWEEDARRQSEAVGTVDGVHEDEGSCMRAGPLIPQMEQAGLCL